VLLKNAEIGGEIHVGDGATLKVDSSLLLGENGSENHEDASPGAGRVIDEDDVARIAARNEAVRDFIQSQKQRLTDSEAAENTRISALPEDLTFKFRDAVVHLSGSAMVNFHGDSHVQHPGLDSESDSSGNFSVSQTFFRQWYLLKSKT
jgi:hypothetical protein